MGILCGVAVMALPASPAFAKAELDNASLSPAIIRSDTRATLRFSVNQATGVRLLLSVQKVGRYKASAGGCKAPSARNRGGKPCTYIQRLSGSRVLKAKRGVNTTTVTRRWAGRTLKRGTYTLTLRTTDGDTNRLVFEVR